ncbi:Agglutinin-like protein 1 [Spathaspora sp. JA1]|nr:Agglutinin-like protein 1 [Spathaspora sp. JA1]
MLLPLILFPLLFSFVTSEHITKVFKSFESLKFSESEYSFLGPGLASWIADLIWELDGSWMKPGDTFTLNMPCVFKFTTPEQSIHLTANSTDYANCIFSPGDISYAYSELKCVLLPTVNQSTKAIGKISIPLTFNPGYSSLEIDVQCSKIFHHGVNTVSFYDGDNVLSTETTFTGGSSTVATTIIYSLRTIPSINKQQQYLLQGSCPRGHVQGLLGIRILGGTGSIDCSSMRTYATNSLNAWYYPKNIYSYQYEWDCKSQVVSFLYSNMPAGYRVFLEGYINRIEGVQLQVEYVNKFICQGLTPTFDGSKTVSWEPYSDIKVVAKDLDVTTRTWTGSTTQMSTMSYEQSDQTISVVVEVPIPTTTITSSYIGISTSFTTYTVDPGATATVIEYEPVHEIITETSCWDNEETVTSTLIDPDWATDTVLIVTPCEVTTVEPITEEPTTEVSTTEELTTDEPASEPFIPEEPTHEEPTPAEPAPEQLTTVEPAPKEVIPEAPIPEEVTTGGPIPEEETVEQTTDDAQPSTEEYTTEKPYLFLGPGLASWIADLVWELDGSWMKPGDTFTLNMPCVFKFTTPEPSIHLHANSTDYANCVFSPGDISHAYSELKCVLLPTVNQSTKAIGKISVPLTFNPGYSSSEIDLKCSTMFRHGVNTVSFYDGDNILSTQTTFTGGSSTVPTTIIYSLRTVPSINKQQQYLLQGSCPRGHVQGLLGIRILGGTGSIDCSSMRSYMTNTLNPWYYPKNAYPYTYQWSCRSQVVSFLYGNMASGYRVFLEGFINRIEGVKLQVEYVNQFECRGLAGIFDGSKLVTWEPYSDINVVAKDLDVTTRTWTGSTTQMSTMSYEQSDQTISVVVEVPIPTTTLTSSYIGISTSFTTYTVDPGATATVIEYEPVHEIITETSCWDNEETVTSTLIDPDWATDTEPTTDEPTTDDPEEPTTEEPTTDDPTSEDPTSEDPTSEEPTTDPTTDDPEEPTTDEPTTDDPTSEDPTSEEPTTDEPTTDDPEEPTTDEPTTDDPTSEDPTSEEPTSEEPTTDEPTTDDPTSEDPTSEDPTSEEPTTDEPTSEEPTTEEPTTDDPTSEEPTSEDPTSEEPTTDEPTSEEPTSEQPTTDEPTTKEPTTKEPTTEEQTETSSTEVPTTEGPMTVESTYEDPSEEPSTEEPTEQPMEDSTEETTEEPTPEVSTEDSCSGKEASTVSPTAQQTTDLSIETSLETVTPFEEDLTTVISGETSYASVLTKSVKSTYTTVHASDTCSSNTFVSPVITSGTVSSSYNAGGSSSSDFKSVSAKSETYTFADVVSTIEITPLHLILVLLRTLLI